MLYGDVVNVNSKSGVQSTDRRSFLRTSLLLSTAAITHQAQAEIPDNNPSFSAPRERKLRLVNDNTRERLDVVYWRDGNYIGDHLGQLHYFMRDHHVNKPRRMDPKLYDLLHTLYARLDTDKRIHVLSGYRTTATNNLLKEKIPGVSTKSYHIKGRAADIYIPGVKNDIIQKEARKLKLGGVGYYLTGGFVHVDTGYVRHWVNK